MGWGTLLLVISACGYALITLIRHHRTLVQWGKIGHALGSDDLVDGAMLRWPALREVLEASDDLRPLLLHDLRHEVGRELQKGALLRLQAARITLFAGAGGFLITWWDHRAVAWGIVAFCLCSTVVCVLVSHIAAQRSVAVRAQMNRLIRRLASY